MEPLDPPPVTGHPMVAALGRVAAAVNAAGLLPVWSLDARSTAETLSQLASLQSQLAAVSLSVLAHGDSVDVAGPSGAPNTATWLAVATRATRLDAFAQTRLAASLDSARHGCVQGALADGRLRVDQAEAIVAAVDVLCTESTDLPAVDADVVLRAEAWLVEQAAFHDATRLRVLGQRILEVVAPGLADAFEAHRLGRDEARASAHTRLTMAHDGHGSVFVKAKLPGLQGAMLKKILMAYAAPKHQAAKAAKAAADGVPTAERRASPERMGRAFCDLLESLDSADLPEAGGTGATVVVTMDLDSLTGGLRSAGLDTGERITAATARRLACQAGIIPAVLGAQSVPLDLGRQTRFHTRSQRVAIALRDGGCTADGCDWPLGMCHVHHDPAWQSGGTTDVLHARMLCPHHHARAHDPGYDVSKKSGGKITFHRRTWTAVPPAVLERRQPRRHSCPMSVVRPRSSTSGSSSELVTPHSSQVRTRTMHRWAWGPARWTLDRRDVDGIGSEPLSRGATLAGPTSVVGA